MHPPPANTPTPCPVQVPMFRSQSARATRTCYENVEPPRRQSDIVRATRSPSYENANTFHVRRPNSFDVEDLRRDPSRCVSGLGVMKHSIIELK